MFVYVQLDVYILNTVTEVILVHIRHLEPCACDTTLSHVSYVACRHEYSMKVPHFFRARGGGNLLPDVNCSIVRWSIFMDPEFPPNREKLNIAFVCDAVTDCVAGSFISTLRFSERLAARGHKVIYIAAKSPRHPTDTTHGAIKAYRFRGFLLPKSEGQLYIAFSNTKKIKRILEDEGIHVVHTVIPTPLSVASTNAARALGIKVVAHSHTQPENLTMHIPNKFIQQPINKYFYRYLSWLYSKADALIYPSEFAKKLMTNIHADIQTHVISNGVETERFAPVATEEFFEKFDIPSKRTIVLYAGRLHPEKSLDTLIRAVPHILEETPDAYFLLAGFGHQDTMLMALARKLGVDRHVKFLGRVSDEEMVMAQHAADIFVLPSLAELEGMVVLEAMAAGKPIVIANSPESASTYFVDGNGLLFEPRDHRDLATQVIRLVNDSELRSEMSARSLQMSKDYDINESVRRLEELYYSLLEK